MQLGARLTHEPEGSGLTPDLATFVYPSADSRRTVVS